MQSESEARTRAISAGILVAALGYFVDVYDLILFSVVRIPSLKSIQVSDENLLSTGVLLLNSQMLGMLLGGIVWGVWGDKRGRISVLFGSIFLYSVANILNGFVSTVPGYAVLRFVAGLGLAGELGAGITLVSESMPKETRGFGTTLVATVGVCGAVVAGLTADFYSWRTSYFVGGGLGLFLLVLRFVVYESGMYEALKVCEVSRGNLLLLFRSRERLVRYVSCLFVGLPIWYAVGILVTFSPEISKQLGIAETVSVGRAILFTYAGLVVGDLVSGILSQIVRSRRKVIGLFLFFTTCSVLLYLSELNNSLDRLYVLCVPLGFSVGYWAVFVTSAAEQFGTNLRATVTTTAPNFVRGTVIPITMLFEYLRGSFTITMSAAIVGGACIVLALIALSLLSETFGRDLEFIEE